MLRQQLLKQVKNNIIKLAKSSEVVCLQNDIIRTNHTLLA